MTQRSGYTLLEVMVAFAIMTAVLAVILPGQSQVLRQSSNAEVAFLAADYAQSRLDRLGVSDLTIPNNLTETYRDWRVVWTTQPLSDFEGYFAVTITVEDARGLPLATLKSVKRLGG